MRSNTTVCIVAVCLCLITALMIPFIDTFAQSGRVVPKPTPSPEDNVPNWSLPKSVLSPNADKYKLIFVARNAGKIFYSWDKEEREGEAANRNYWLNFTEQLNQAGDQGYRLVSTDGQGALAITRLGEAQYEYLWFDTNSHLFFAKNGFEEKFTRWARQGFSLVDHVFRGRACKAEPWVPPDHPNAGFQTNTENCRYLDRYFLERVKGANTAKTFRLVRHVPRWRALTDDAGMTEQINHYLSVGLYPTHVFSRYEVLLQEVADKNTFAINKPEIQVFAEKVQKLPKRINELAQQGYRLISLRDETAVMSRFPSNRAPVSYVWLQVTDRRFEAELARLQAQGAIYRMTQPNGSGEKTSLIFEQPSANDGRLREYKTLRFELEIRENRAQKMVERDLSPASKENVKMLNRLANEGFEARDLFDLSYVKETKVGVILERVR